MLMLCSFLLCACLVALYFSSEDWDVGMESAVRHFVYTQPKHFSNALPATLGWAKHVLSAHVGSACVRVCVWAHVCML